MSFYSSFAAYYERIFPFSETVYAFLRRCLPEPPATCLDVGCGTGHYAGRLARDGFDAVGIDLDPAMIAEARRRYPQAAFRRMDMLDVAALPAALTAGAGVTPNPAQPLDPSIFDAAYCIGNTAAHLTPADFARFLAGLGPVLAPGAPWIVQVMNWDFVTQQSVLAQGRVTFPVVEAGDARFYREYRELSARQVTFVTRLEVGGETIFEDAVPLYPLRSAQLRAAHAQAGFEVVGHFGSYARAPFDPHTFSANILVCRYRGDAGRA